MKRTPKKIILWIIATLSSLAMACQVTNALGGLGESIKGLFQFNLH